MKNSRAAAILLAVLLFGCGIAVGALGNRYYETRVVNAKPQESFHDKYLRDMRHNLHLTDDQVAKLKVIMEETHARMKAFHEETRPQIEAIKHEHADKVEKILTPDQIPTYRQMLAEHDRQARQNDQNR